MRVLLLSQEFPPETGWGGIGTYTGLIAPALVRQGAEVHVLSVVRGQTHDDRLVDGVYVHRRGLPRPRGIGRVTRMPHSWARLSLALAVVRQARGLGRFDVVESPEWMAEGLLWDRRWAPLVVRLHSGAWQVAPWLGPLTADRRVAALLEHRLVHRADLVTGTSAQLGSVATMLGVPSDRQRAVTYPVSLARAAPAPSHGPRILLAGRFEDRKGHDTILKAMPAVLERIPAARAVLLGADTGGADGSSRLKALRAQAEELGVAHAVSLIERWGRDAVMEELEKAAVCVVPSRWESFGYVAAEAASVGRPVVASRIAALADVVQDGDTGVLVDPEDVAGWSRSLVRLLAEPAEAAAMGSRARDRIARVCAPERIAAQTLEAYEAAGLRTRPIPSSFPHRRK